MFPDAHLGLGNLHMKEGQFEAALESYERARDGFVEMGDMIFELQAKRYLDTQRQITELRDTLTQYRNALSRGTTSTDSHVERQITEIEESIRRMEAIEMPRRDAPKEPPGEVHFYIGNAQFRLGRFEDAQKSWEACALKSPKFAMVHNNLAVAYWKTARFDDAKSSLVRAAELGFPVNPQLKADLEKAAAAAAPTPQAERGTEP